MKISIGSITLVFEVKKDVSWVEISIPVKTSKIEMNIRHAPLSESGQTLTVSMSVIEKRGQM